MKLKRTIDRRRGGLALLLTAVLVLAGACSAPKEAGETTGAGIFLDGNPWTAGSPLPEGKGDLTVYVTLDGETLMTLPFEEPHVVRIVLPDGGENTLTLTGTAVTMTEANCEGQDCVRMGEITRENLEVRVMGGFIICLPHRVSVEVRSRD